MLINWPHAWKARRREVIEGFRGLPSTFVSCLTASGALLLLAHGTFNDWAMRTTLPLSIVLTVAFTQVLLAELKGAYFAILLIILVLSSAASLAELALGAVVPANCAPYGFFSIKDMGPLAFQYEGRRDSILYRYLVRWR